MSGRSRSRAPSAARAPRHDSDQRLADRHEQVPRAGVHAGVVLLGHHPSVPADHPPVGVGRRHGLGDRQDGPVGVWDREVTHAHKPRRQLGHRARAAGDDRRGAGPHVPERPLQLGATGRLWGSTAPRGRLDCRPAPRQRPALVMEPPTSQVGTTAGGGVTGVPAYRARSERMRCFARIVKVAGFPSVPVGGAPWSPVRRCRHPSSGSRQLHRSVGSKPRTYFVAGASRGRPGGRPRRRLR